MPFNKDDPRINRNGRPSGSRNKVRAARDVKRAVGEGMSLQDICSMLSTTIMNPKTSETQRNQALKQLIDLKKFLTTTEIKLIDDRIEEEEGKKNKTNTTEIPKGVVAEFPKTKFKKRS